MAKKTPANATADREPTGKVKLYALRLPGKHKGKIPAAVIRAAVRKVVGERKRREAEEAAMNESPHTAG